MLQGTWKEKRFTCGLDAGWESGIRITISVFSDNFFALGNVRECNSLGKCIGITACMRSVCDWNCRFEPPFHEFNSHNGKINLCYGDLPAFLANKCLFEI
jgi:hypothetical protein